MCTVGWQGSEMKPLQSGNWVFSTQRSRSQKLRVLHQRGQRGSNLMKRYTLVTKSPDLLMGQIARAPVHMIILGKIEKNVIMYARGL